MKAAKAKILIVEDEAVIALDIAGILTSGGYEVMASLSSAEDAVAFVRRRSPDLILMDIVLGGAMDGIGAADAIRNIADVPVVYLTAHSDGDIVARVKPTVPYGFVSKPVNRHDLISLIEITLVRHDAEKRIRESEERYRSFVENFQGITFQGAADFSTEFIHGSVEAITGYRGEDIVSENPRWDQIIHPDDLPLIREDAERMRTVPGFRTHREYRIIRRDGSERWLDVYVQNVCDSTGRPARVNGVMLDVTERKTAQETVARKNQELEALNEELASTIEELEAAGEEYESQNRELIRARGELEKSESYLKSIFRMAPVGIGIMHGRSLEMINDEFRRMTGYGEDELLGTSTRILYVDDSEFESVGAMMRDQIASHGIATLETRWRRRDGTVIDILVRGTRLDPSDARKGTAFAALDITGRKRMEKELDDSRKAWQEIFQAIGQPTLILDPSHRILDANREVTKAFGIGHRDLIGRYCFEIFHSSSAEPAGCPMRKLIESGDAKAVEMEIEALKRTYLVSCTPVYDGRGVIQKIIHIAADITERKRAEEELMRLTAILEQTSDFVSYATVAGEIQYINSPGKRMLGYPEDIDVREIKNDSYCTAESADLITRVGVPSAVENGTWAGETVLLTKEGKEIPVSQVIIAHKSPEGELRYFSTIIRDISAQKSAEKTLRENEEKLRNIVENSTNAFYTHTPDHVLTYLSPRVVDIMGYEPEEVMVRWTELATDNPVNERGLELTEQAIRTGRQQPPYELELRHKEGRLVYVEVHEAPVVVNGKTTAVVGSLTDITERKKAEAALKLSEERYRNLVETMQEGMVVIDADNRISYVNPMLCEMFGYAREELVGTSPLDYLDEKNAAIFVQQVANRRTGKSDVYELEWTTKDGRRVLTQISPKPLYDASGNYEGSFGVITDITERRRAEELMLQNEKMMTIGGLAAGMAHEINNPLGIILQGVQATQLKLSGEYEINRKLAADTGVDLALVREYLEKSEILTYLKGISEAGMRAADIVTSMLQFSRRSTGRKMKTDINDIIERSIEMASRDYDLKKKYDFKNIVITRDYDRSIPPVNCVPMEIEQVVLNLLKNAAHAMAEKAGGGFVPHITITSFSEPGLAVVRISDNGTGIDDYTRKHLFEPFYTTKAPGEGTGLGLAVSFFIIAKNHGGSITADSVEGEGTSFTIKLPMEV